MNLKDIGRMAADEADGDAVVAESSEVGKTTSVHRQDGDYGRVENGDGTVTLSFDFNLDPEYAAEMAKAMPKGQTREDQVDASVVQDAAVDIPEGMKRKFPIGKWMAFPSSRMCDKVSQIVGYFYGGKRDNGMDYYSVWLKGKHGTFGLAVYGGYGDHPGPLVDSFDEADRYLKATEADKSKSPLARFIETQDEAVDGDARHAETPIENCRAKDPVFCPYHGTQVMTQKLQTMLKAHGIDGKVEVTGKGYHFTAKVTVPAQDEQSAVADVYNGFLQQKGFVAVKKGAKGDDQAESNGEESSYEAEVKVDEPRRLEPRELMSEWVDNIIDRLANDPDAKKQISRNDYLDMLGAVAEMHKAAEAASQNPTDPNLGAAAKAAYDKASDTIDAITAMIDYKDVKTVDDGKRLSDGYDKTVATAKATYAPLDQQVRQKKVALFGARGAYPQGFAQEHPWAATKLSAKLSDFSATGKTLAEAEAQMRAAYGSLQTAGKGGTDALSYAERKSLRIALQKMSAAASQVEGHAVANEKRSKEVIAKLDELIAANPNGLAKPQSPKTSVKPLSGPVSKMYSSSGGQTTEVEVQLGGRSIAVTGVSANAARGIKNRVSSALTNSGFADVGNFTANLSGATGNVSRFDLPVALAALNSKGQFKGSSKDVTEYAPIGELAMDGQVRGIGNDAVNAVNEMKRIGKRGVLISVADSGEIQKANIQGIDVIPVRTLKEAVGFFDGSVTIYPISQNGGQQ